MSWCAFSVDLDSADDYARAFPLGDDAALFDDIYAQCAGTLKDFLSAQRLAATLFVVTRDVARPVRAEALTSLQEAGHELALHSHSHRPALDDATLSREFDLSVAELRALTGRQPRGYRAPSYVVHDSLYEQMVKHGLAFSSSVLGTPLIVLFKLLFNVKTIGRDLPARERWWAWGRLPAMFSPRRPYPPRPTQFWRADSGGAFIEIPLTCVPWFGVPFQFTYVAPFADEVVRQWAGLLAVQPINTSFHLLDFIDDSLSARLGAFNPNLRVPLAERVRKAALLIELARAGRTDTMLHEVASDARRRIHDSRP